MLSVSVNDSLTMIHDYCLGEPVVLESSSKDLEVNEGDSVTLICNAQGSITIDATISC
jgi:hypothetical protein